MSKEPCMTLKELARLKGMTLAGISARAKKKPYPEPVIFIRPKNATPVTYHGHKQPKHYRRSELLKWFEDTKQ